jgi:hypothetical protein
VEETHKPITKNIRQEVAMEIGRECCYRHRLSFNRPTKRGKEKSSSVGHCQCEKEMDEHLLACQQILEREPHSDTLC